MKWMRERDLLIAQTMEFVQSVTGKRPETEKTVATSISLLSVETRAPAANATAMPDIEALLAEPTYVAQPRRPAPIPRPELQNDVQSEIRARVANFRAHQERFSREREAYCSATMAKVHAALREDIRSPRLSK
jgi:hypothetical protein